jgi:hypothetical protein
MSIDAEIISKFEEILAHRRSKEPLNVEMNRLMNDIYPYDKLHSIFKLGSAQMLAVFKNHVYKYMCKDDRDYIDAIVKANLDDQEMKGFLDKLIIKEEKPSP